MTNYGLPYMGSKNKIAEWVLSYLPCAENFYDLFCGGCAITHCAITHNKYKNYVINDIKGIMPKLFIDCLNGKYKNEKRWISREDFFKLKDIDGYVHTCFSFGNRGITYMYNKDLEPYKKAFHYAIFFDNYELMNKYGLDFSPLKNIKGINNKRLYVKEILKNYCDAGIVEKKGSHYTFNKIVNFDQLQNLERLNRLNTIKTFNKVRNIEAYSKSYDEINIKPNSVIYCDIPYKSTGTYNDNPFDYDKFYEWALKQTQHVFISEYNMPKDFICIAEKEKRSTMSSTSNNTHSVEKIFIPKTQVYKPIQQTLF